MAEYIRQDHHLPHGSLEPTITNGDRIRMMTDEELAEMLYNIDGDENWDSVPVTMIMGHAFLDEGEVLEWLGKEAKDEHTD